MVNEIFTIIIWFTIWAYSPKNYYADSQEIILNQEKFKNKLFSKVLVVKNVMNKEKIKILKRDQYCNYLESIKRKIRNGIKLKSQKILMVTVIIQLKIFLNQMIF